MQGPSGTGDSTGDALLALRQQIDAIDNQLHDLLMARTELAVAVGAAKAAKQPVKGDSPAEGAKFIRPAREAKILRRLVARQSHRVPGVDRPVGAATLAEVLGLLEEGIAAGEERRVDQRGFLEAEGLNRRFERAIENERLDEFRRLQQRITLARAFRQILIQIAEKARVAVRVGEIAPETIGIRVHGPEKIQQLPPALRARGLPAYFTIDAGPHVKVLTTAEHEEEIARALDAVPGVKWTIRTRPGGPAALIDPAP